MPNIKRFSNYNNLSDSLIKTVTEIKKSDEVWANKNLVALRAKHKEIKAKGGDTSMVGSLIKKHVKVVNAARAATEETVHEEQRKRRGRPRKNPLPTSKPKVDEWGEPIEDYGPDIGPEADQNIMVHLRKVIDTDGSHEIHYQNNKKAKLNPQVARELISALEKLKPDSRLKLQQHMNQSHENLVQVHNLIKGKGHK